VGSAERGAQGSSISRPQVPPPPRFPPGRHAILPPWDSSWSKRASLSLTTHMKWQVPAAILLGPAAMVTCSLALDAAARSWAHSEEGPDRSTPSSTAAGLTLPYPA
jgi:hypothetical protein